MPVLMQTKGRRSDTRTLRGWAISVLQEAGAIREYQQHGGMRDCAAPHARERAFDIARAHPPMGVSPQAAAASVSDILGSIGDTGPEVPARNRLVERER